jgi:galactokinase
MSLMDQRDAAPVLRVVPYTFAQAFGYAPAGVWSAPYALRLSGVPGRNGIVTAVGWQVVIAAAPRTDGLLRVGSLNRPGDAVEIAIHETGHEVPPWAAPIVDTAHALGRVAGPKAGIDIVLHADLPEAAGLAPSAPLSCATALAWTAFHGPQLAVAALDALLRNVVPPPSDTADADALRSAVLYGGDERALLVGPAGPTGEVPLELDATGLRVMLVIPRDKGVPHTPMASVVESLRGARDETERAQRMEAFLRDRELPRGLSLLTASHLSRVPGYGTGWAEADATVDAVKLAGAVGARLAGGGGSAVAAFVPGSLLPGIRAAVVNAFRDRGRLTPRFLTASGGPAATPVT